ncbi:DUF1385 domain-containing protein [Thermodesulfobacteriota bacterium]
MGKKITVGGQAVIEGVMMRSPKSLAIAVRKPNGEIVIKNDVWVSLSEKMKFLKKPFLRGVVVLIESLVNGISALTYSANMALDEGDEDKKEDEKLHPLAMAATIATAFGFGMLLFVVLPHYLTDLISRYSSSSFSVNSYKFHLIDGAIKVSVFIAYILIISLMNDIKRVFMYHGAEHKSIFAHEAGDELTVENAKKYSTLHPRCGTSFIMIVLLISIFMFSSIFPLLPKFPDLPKYLRNLIYVFIKIPMMLPIAGISYEVIKLSGKKRNSKLLKFISAPGMLMQKITTKEPTDDQLEVALAALKAALETEAELAKAKKEEKAESETISENKTVTAKGATDVC